MTTLRSRIRRAALRGVISSIPQGIARTSDGQEILSRCGQLILDRIKAAFMVKSGGGTDDAGDRWVPLKPATIAYSRSQRNKIESARQSRPSQSLNAKQQSRWWQLYRQGLAMFRGDKSRAAKRAWVILKGEGATTLISKYGGRKVDILYKTGGLYNSIEEMVISPSPLLTLPLLSTTMEV